MSEHRFAIRDREARISGRSFDRNKQAKYKFLTESNGEVFQRGSSTRRSLPGKSRIDREAEEEEEPKYVDLSVPGTPVSSRHVMSLKYRNKLAEQDKEERDKQFEEQLDDEDPLKKFLQSMKALNAKKSAESSIVVEVPAKPELQRRNSYGYNNIGTWNSSSNLQGYTVLFQRSMSAKVDYDQHTSTNPNQELDTTGDNLMDVPDDKPDLVDEDNASESKPATSQENEIGDKKTEVETVEIEKPVIKSVKEVEKIDKVKRIEVEKVEVSEKPKSKDKSKNRYVNFWRKLTGYNSSKDQDKKTDTRN